VLTSDDIDRLCADGRVDAVARRAIVPLDGAMLAIVMDGYFRIFRNAAFVRDVTLGLATGGDVLAPGVAFGVGAAETGAEAVSPGHVLLLAPDAWERHAAADPGLNVRLAASVGRRIGHLQKKLEQFSRAGVESRVATTLLELANDHGTPTPAGTRLDLPLSQEDLARLAGTTRETCSSLVADFARRGLVRGGRLRGMIVTDQPGLAALAAAAI
jgi:CRP-like cAMP-binding protein